MLLIKSKIITTSVNGLTINDMEKAITIRINPPRILNYSVLPMLVVVFDRSHTCDFVARVRDFIAKSRGIEHSAIQKPSCATANNSRDELCHTRDFVARFKLRDKIAQ